MRLNTIKLSLLSSILLAGFARAQSEVSCETITCPTSYKQCSYLEQQCCDRTYCQLPAKNIDDQYKTFYKAPKDSKTATVTKSKKPSTATPTQSPYDCTNVQCPDCQPYCLYCDEELAYCCPNDCKKTSEFQVDPRECKYVNCDNISGDCDIVEQFCCGLKECNKPSTDDYECNDFSCPYLSFCDSLQLMCCGFNSCEKI